MANPSKAPAFASGALELLHRVGVALSSEKNKDRLVEMILVESKKLCDADGGTIYLRTYEALYAIAEPAAASGP